MIDSSLLSRDDLEVLLGEEEAVLAVDARPQPRHHPLPPPRLHQPHPGRRQDVERRLRHLRRRDVLQGEVQQGGYVVEDLVGTVLQAGDVERCFMTCPVAGLNNSSYNLI